MRLSDSAVRKLAVVTETGDPIGRVRGMVIDTDSHQVIQYLVTRNRSLPSLLPGDLLIHFSQVVSMDDRRMVVRGTVTEMESAAEVFRQQVRDAAGAVSRMTGEKA
ncbi:PRC-barrel domain-containing protein [Candidatus Uhrbacteria bacterium]|nr:PRC-barrel domain-containing protein [Candidatus Uhrbacteria bacterium]